MMRSRERLLVTHTGSLPRPAPLVALYARRAAGDSVDAEALAALGREATRHAVARQIETGIDVGNNGEQERESFFLHVQHRMAGFSGRWQRVERQDVARYPRFGDQMRALAAGRVAVSSFDPPKATGPVRYIDSRPVVDECRSFRVALDAATGSFVEPFLTAPSPGIVASAMRNEYYDSEAAYLQAVADALRVEYEAIVAQGFTLQLDCPDLALERHVSYQNRPLHDFLGFVERVVDAINGALANVPRERVRLHVCWGNYEGPHDCDVELEHILPLLLDADVGALVLPFANPRHAHEYRCLAKHRLGDDQLLVAGVIDTLTNLVEHPEVVAERLERVARAVGDPSRILAGTDCGFDTSAGMGRVAEDVVWAKLRTLVDGARLASERLY
ncbi:MAG: cobalamin-independent methionine synthase II family protein [Gammaproteobacteria bacterium]|nr:cobalamin-independent methionine synthase II family protein [Gammaproteobacteria bacterium]